MWPDEIEWTIQQLEKYLPRDSKTCIDVGSEGVEYRTQRQPWNQGFYDYLTGRGMKISTMDINTDSKAHYIHDITEVPVGIGPFDLVIATHLLEHVPMDKMEDVVTNLELMVAGGRYLWASVPNKYPYHERPIDNNWRPTDEELVRQFSGRVIVAKTFEVEHTKEEYSGKPKNSMSCVMLSY